MKQEFVYVALLAEGVDRNWMVHHIGILVGASPSSRRAWIEMLMCLDRPCAFAGRPPRGGRG